MSLLRLSRERDRWFIGFQRVFLRFSLHYASEAWQVPRGDLNLDKYYGYGDGDYVHVDEPPHVHVLSNYLLLSPVFIGYDLGSDFVFHKHHYIQDHINHSLYPTLLHGHDDFLVTFQLLFQSQINFIYIYKLNNS